MEYIDSAMVGGMGAQASAAIGLVSTTTWLLGGICSSAASGFSVQVAHLVGAQQYTEARNVFRQALVSTLLLSLAISVLAVSIAPSLPIWLGGSVEIQHDATLYFLVFGLSLPICEINYLCSAMLRSTGNMRVPSLINIIACILDILFNYLFIFVLKMGVLGAALGTACSMLFAAIALLWFVLFRSPVLGLMREKGSWRLQRTIVNKAVQIGAPMAVQHIAMCMAYICSTLIVAPLGTVAIAAHSFGIIIEGLCYMPGYGIGDAVTTLVGQSIGASRGELQKSFAWISVALGVCFMTMMGVLMFVGIPYLMPLMTPDIAVQELTITVLRIEAFAEPFYALSIVIYGVCVGCKDTKIPSMMNLLSIWLVRLPLAVYLSSQLGLVGVWMAMAAELTFRGFIFLVRMIITNKNISL